MVHPIDTAYNVASAIGQLYELGRAGQWDLLKQALVPEIYEAAKEWDTLTPFEQGEKSSVIASKYVSDFLIPGSLVKVVSKSTKLASQLLRIEQKLAKMPIGFAGQGAAFAARETGILAEEFGVVAKEAGMASKAPSGLNGAILEKPPLDLLKGKVIQTGSFSFLSTTV